MPALDPLLTTAQTAALLGLQAQTLRKWRLQGLGPPYVRLGDGPGARVAYRQGDIDAWVAARVYTSTAAETVARGAR